MTGYEPPMIIASFDEADLIDDAAAVCFYANASDSRLKEEIRPIGDSVTKLRQIGQD